MSGFSLIFRRDGSPVESDELPPMMNAMRHRAIHGTEELCLENLALGHHRFWVMPEERGERQPIADSRERFLLLFEGRIDNRKELYQAIPSPRRPLNETSDARLVLEAYEAWGEGTFERLLGPFVIVVVDRKYERIVLARDPLGDRCLSWAMGGGLFIASTDEAALLSHPQVDARVNPRRMAVFFGVRELVDGETFFRGIRHLMPGEFITVTRDDVRRARYWEFEQSPDLRYRRDDEYAQEFRSLLGRAVDCRLRGRDLPGVMLSGGLDSAPIAALAARGVTKAGDGLPTLSWVFDEFESCDERAFLRDLYTMHPLDPIHVGCDDAWPLGEPDRWPVHPTTPEQNPYREFHERTFRMASERGIRTLLSGMCGDQLYSNAQGGWIDLLSRAEFAEASRALISDLAQRGLASALKDSVRRPLAGTRLHGILRPRRAPEWLTPEAAELLPEDEPWPRSSSQMRRPAQSLRVLELMNGHGLAVESYYANRFGVELRYPFRDRRLIEFMLSVPADQLQHRGVERPILRRAMEELLPASILERRSKTSFHPLFLRGLQLEARPFVRRFLLKDSAVWSTYADREWVVRALESESPSEIQQLVVWLCICCELWFHSANSYAR